MKNSILVPVDGSELSERALKVAGRILKGKEDAHLTILRALETPRLSAWLPAEMLNINQKERDLVRSYLEEAKKQWGVDAYEVDTVLAPGPGPVDAVLTHCQEKGTKLVVMSGHGYSGWVQALLGSNAEKILRRCEAPVLVVKSDPEAVPDPGLFQKILIPLDGSKRAEQALRQVLALGPGGSAQVLLVGVSVVFQGHAFEGDLRLVVEPDMKKVGEYLESQAEWLRNQGYQVETSVARGAPAQEILRLADEEDADLILMTTQGRGNYPFWHYGSVAERVLRHCECSVLVLKEPIPEEGSQEPREKSAANV